MFPLAQSKCRCCSVRGRRRGPEQTVLQQGRRHEPTDHDDTISASPFLWQRLRQLPHLQMALVGQAQHLPRRLRRLTHRCRQCHRHRGRPNPPPSISICPLLAPPSAAAMRGPFALGLNVYRRASHSFGFPYWCQCCRREGSRTSAAHRRRARGGCGALACGAGRRGPNSRDASMWSAAPWAFARARRWLRHRRSQAQTGPWATPPAHTAPKWGRSGSTDCRKARWYPQPQKEESSLRNDALRLVPLPVDDQGHPSSCAVGSTMAAERRQASMRTWIKCGKHTCSWM